MSKKSSAASAAKGITKAFSFWQDREIRFDSQIAVLELRENTEHVYATFKNVEDTKGNNGHSGVLLVTNLRLVWWSTQRSSLNLSIGYYCIHKLSVQESESKLAGGTTESLTISAKYGSSRFQFLFSIVHTPPGAAAAHDKSHASRGRSVSGGGQDSHNTTVMSDVSATRSQASQQQQQRLHATIHAVWSAYESTRVYRELRVRSAAVQNGNVVLLRGEQVISRLSGVTNVSKEEGILGTFVVTNIRVVWFATQESFNVSVPYLQFTGLRSQMSKFGHTLVIETSSYAGNFILGFRIDPDEKLNEVYAEISSMWRTWSAKPILGLQVELQDTMAATLLEDTLAEDELPRPGERSAQVSRPWSAFVNPTTGSSVGTSQKKERQMEGSNVVRDAPTDAFAAYYADDGQKGVDRRPVYEPSIGLAVEKLRKGATIQSLWDASVPS